MTRMVKILHIPLVLLVVSGFFLSASGLVWAGAYADSAHGQNVTRTATASAGYPVGSCAHCHEQHASVAGAEHVPNENLLFTGLTGSDFCLSCHDGSETIKNLATNWNSGSFGHGPLGADMICADCHDPHYSKPVHSEAVDGNQVYNPGTGDTFGSIVGTSGVEPIWPVTADPAPNSAVPESLLAPFSFTEKDPIEKEYQLCFKCHSDPAVNPYNPKTIADMNNTTGDLTLVAAQFNPNQYAHHPVTGTANWRNPNVIAGLLSPWKENVNARMYCSDCHGDPVSGASGAHASNIKYMLKASGSPDNPSAPDSYDNLCLLCHSGYNADGGTQTSPWSHGSNAAHQYQGEAVGENRYGCRACHGGAAGVDNPTAVPCQPSDNGGKMGAFHGEKFFWGAITAVDKGSGLCGTTPIRNSSANPADHFLMGGYLVGIALDNYTGGNDGDGTCWGGMEGATDGCSAMGTGGKGW